MRDIGREGGSKLRRADRTLCFVIRMYNTVQLNILGVQVVLCAIVLLPVLNNAKERVATTLMRIKGLQSVVPVLVLAYAAIFTSAFDGARSREGWTTSAPGRRV